MAVNPESPNQLFLESIPVALIQPDGTGPMSSVVEIVLKIIERRLESGEKEYRLEISRADEFEFLYAEGFTRTKYQTLANKWNINVDFDEFPARIVRVLQQRTESSFPLQLTCTLSQDLTVCTFEILHIIDTLYTFRMRIELKAVRGKELLCHVINNLRSLQTQFGALNKEKKQVEQERDQLKSDGEELRDFRIAAEQKVAELQQRFKELEKQLADETLRREEFEQDLQLERDERDSALNKIDHLKEELAEAEKYANDLENDLDECEEECAKLGEKLRDKEALCNRLRCDKENLITALTKSKKDLSKANHVISKYLKNEIRSPSDRSLEESRLEMAADLKMKESLIDEMTASIADYTKKVEELTKENKTLQDTLHAMELERERNARVIEMYRNQHRVCTAATTGTSPPVFTGHGTAGILGRSSPLIGCVPSTPSNLRNVLGRTLQSNTALLTPSLRAAPPLPPLKGTLTNSGGRENLPPSRTLGIEAQPATN